MFENFELNEKIWNEMDKTHRRALLVRSDLPESYKRRSWDWLSEEDVIYLMQGMKLFEKDKEKRDDETLRLVILEIEPRKPSPISNKKKRKRRRNKHSFENVSNVELEKWIQVCRGLTGCQTFRPKGYTVQWTLQDLTDERSARKQSGNWSR